MKITIFAENNSAAYKQYMMEKQFEEFALTYPTEQKDELPAMIRIGNYKGNTVSIPAMLPFEELNGLCFETNRQTRADALLQMQYIALSLLKQVKPELLNLTFVDIGIKNNFPMLSSLNEHSIKFIKNINILKREMETLYGEAQTIYSDYLRGGITTLKEYNKKQEKRKKPYNILFVANFPNEYGEEEINIMSKLINDGANNCGISIIMNLDKEFYPEKDYHNQKRFAKLDTLAAQMVYIDCKNLPKATLNNFNHYNNKTIQDFFSKYNFEFENYQEDEVNELKNKLIQKRKKQDNQPENFLSIPIGWRGNDEIYFEMGKKSKVYSGLIAGAAGTGKSTLLNNIITSIAEKYSPDDIRLYLMDYKDGIEFNKYKKHPNVELLLLDNSRPDVGLETLLEFQKKIGKRNIEFTNLEDSLEGGAVPDIETFNKMAPDKKMPHLLMIIDEAQRLFMGNDYSYNKKVNDLITDVARRGRSVGIHLLFSSQTYMNSKFEDEAKNQMRLRISYQLATGSDCRAILGRDNDAPLRLKQYQLVYNNNYGNDTEDNIIVDAEDFTSEKVNNILQKAAEKYPDHRPKVITKQSETAEIEQNNNGSEIKSSEQNDNINSNKYDKEYFGF